MHVCMLYGTADMQVTRQRIEEQSKFPDDYCPSEKVCTKTINNSETSKHFQLDHCFIENVSSKKLGRSH
jgi:hypothetical protein